MANRYHLFAPLLMSNRWGLAILPFYSLEQLKCPEVVQMNDSECETINTGDD
jgi:hypothetical protein